MQAIIGEQKRFMTLRTFAHNFIPLHITRAITLAIVVLLMLPSVWASEPHAASPGTLQNISGSDTSVKIKVEKEGASVPSRKEKADATIKLEVESKGHPKDSKSRKLKPAGPISPVDTKAIDEATEKIAKKIDALTRVASYWFGDWIAHPILNGITWLKLLISLFVLVCFIAVERTVRVFLDWRLKHLKREGLELSWKGMLLGVVSKPLSALFWIYGTYAAISLLFSHFDTPFGPGVIHNVAKGTANILGALAGIWLVYRLIAVLDRYFLDKAHAPDSKVDRLFANVLGKTIRVFVITIGGLVILQNVTGINTAALLASLGIGGLAFALAAKEPLTNIFGTFTILADKPFKVGEWIKIDNYDGFVESVGYRSTRIRTWDGFQVTVPNQRILSSNLENMATRHFTRWKTTIKLPYGTSTRKLDRAVEIIRGILSNHERMHPDWPPRVYFTGFDDWTLNIFISVWYNSTDWWAYYQWLHDTCRQIKSQLEEENIPLAVPPHALYMAQAGDFDATAQMPDSHGHTPNPHTQD
jgi:MscS family membrane protein